MDTEIPELGSGAEPADRPVWGAAHLLPVKRKGGNGSTQKQSIPGPIPSASVLLPQTPNPIPEAECGQSPQKSNMQMPVCNTRNLI